MKEPTCRQMLQDGWSIHPFQSTSDLTSAWGRSPKTHVVHSLAMLAIICSELSAICKIIRCENEGFGLGSSGSNEQRRLMAQPVEQMVDASWLPLQQRTSGFFKIALMPYERGPLPGYWLFGLLCK